MNRKKKIKSELSDEALIQMFKDNDSVAFDRLVMKHRDMIFNLCFRIMGDYDDANDCAQETFIKMYKNINTFRFKSSFSTWIYRIAVNTCKNRLSSSDRARTANAVRINNPGADESAIDIRDTTYSPDREFETNEKRQAIAQAINSLPDELKVLVVLRDIEGKTYEDISRITGMKSGTIKSRLARARHFLRERLKGVI